MRVMLLKDVYNLGRAGDIKKVADGYGRNFLIPQGLATLATSGALKQVEHIREIAAEQRDVLNQELGSVSEKLDGLELVFPVKSGETGRLYGSVTNAMIAEAIQSTTGMEIDRRQIDSQPIKLIGVHKANVRLTIDLVPEIMLVVHPEGESPESVKTEEIVAEEVPSEAFADLQAELDVMEEEAAKAEADAEAATELEDPFDDTAKAVTEAGFEEPEEAMDSEGDDLDEDLEVGEEDMDILPEEPTVEVSAEEPEATIDSADNNLEEDLQVGEEEIDISPDEPTTEE